MRVLLPFFFATLVAISAYGKKTVDSTAPTVNIQLFHPAPGLYDFFSVASGDVNKHLQLTTGINVNYARRPLVVHLINTTNSTEQSVGSVVENRVDINMLAAIGLFDWGDIGFVFPLVAQGGLAGNAFSSVGIDVGVSDLVAFSPGDLRIIPKFRPLHLRDGLLSVAVLGTIVVPTGGKTPYASENSVVIEPSLAISSDMGFIRFAINGGYRIRDRTKIDSLEFIVDDEIFYKAAASLNINFLRDVPFELVAELFGHTPASNGFGLGTPGTGDQLTIKKKQQKARTPLEFAVGIRTVLKDSILVTLSAGGGLMQGYGAPAPRVQLGLVYYTGQIGIADSDGDTVADATDQCPRRKEDLDGFEDLDGCPDLDNDRDRIMDEDDQCPLLPEDKDGFNDEDGCPEPDNDEDGLLDPKDQCPDVAEDKDGFEDLDGCPDIDNDNDQIADANDKCPDEPEDRDQFQDYDGCPDPDNDNDGLPDINDLCPNYAEDMDGVADDDGCPEDNDGDGILDEQDKCPNKAETYNGIKDEDGCPEKLRVKQLVQVTEDKIEIKEKVFFKTGRSTILKKSFALLDQIASVLKNYTHIKKVRIEGHTDARGSKRRNKKLSQERAQAVMKYLIKKGVEAQRLVARGFGPSRPIASNRSRRGREKNRRVDFVIAEKATIGVDVSEGQEAEGIEIDLDLGGDASPKDDVMFEIGNDEGVSPPPKKDASTNGDDIEFEF